MLYFGGDDYHPLQHTSYQGMNLEEIAKVLRAPRSTVNYRLKKAKTMLKGELEEWYDEE